MRKVNIDAPPWKLFATLSQNHKEGFFFDNWGAKGFSYMGFNPVNLWEGLYGDCLTKLKDAIHLVPPVKKDKDFFQGGIVGLFGYDLRAEFESFDEKRTKPIFPDYRFGNYKDILIYNHHENVYYSKNPQWWEFEATQSCHWKAKDPSIFWEKLLDPKAYEKYVRDAVEYIAAGDIFQANLSHPLKLTGFSDWRDLYQKIRGHNPSPYAGVYFWDDAVILSNSPELLCDLEDGRLRTKPIAGTRPRGVDDSADEVLKKELFLSEKEQAEHIMLVDLERNDMGRLAKYGTVEVTCLMDCESYRNVHHIVSTVEADVRDNVKNWEVLPAVFPGGTITGAPKIRAMEIIHELEDHSRGFYTGSMGWFDGNNDCELNILIRTLQIKGQEGMLHVGAGIVADSNPKYEYLETLAKANAWEKALKGSK